MDGWILRHGEIQFREVEATEEVIRSTPEYVVVSVLADWDGAGWTEEVVYRTKAAAYAAGLDKFAAELAELASRREAFKRKWSG